MTKRTPLSPPQLAVLRFMLEHDNDITGVNCVMVHHLAATQTLTSLAARGLAVTHDRVYYRLTPEGRALAEHL